MDTATRPRESRQIDLPRYAEVFSHFRRRIERSATVQEALALATDFLDQFAATIETDVKSAVLEQVAQLWYTFPERVKRHEKYKELITILMGQAVDFYWYADFPQYASEQDVRRDETLYSFRRFNEDFEVKFRYVQYYGHVLMRVPNSVRLRYRRLVNHPGRYTQGLTTTRYKRAMVGLINQISEDAENELGSDSPFRMLVNSVLRTVRYQRSLAAIGYVAPAQSSHLAGYAVDIEKSWYQEHDPRAHAAIQRTVETLFAAGVVNLIVEHTHWHVCLNPIHIGTYEIIAQRWERNQR